MQKTLGLKMGMKRGKPKTRNEEMVGGRSDGEKYEPKQGVRRSRVCDNWGREGESARDRGRGRERAWREPHPF